MTRRTITALFVMAAAASALGCNSASAKPTEDTARAAASAPAGTLLAAPDAVPDKVVVYYFHGDRRCRTCMGIQSTIVKTIKERFAAETGSGALAFQEINYEASGNEHFVKDFDLSSSTMVVTARKGQALVKWENTKVWDYAHDDQGLADYTEKQIRAYLGMLKKS